MTGNHELITDEPVLLVKVTEPTKELLGQKILTAF